MPGTKNENEEKDFPGYPHYPKKDDIMNAGNERVDVDAENLSRSNLTSSAAPDKSVRKNTSKQEAPGDMDADRITEEGNREINEDEK